jgi:hypothetical protein
MGMSMISLVVSLFGLFCFFLFMFVCVLAALMLFKAVRRETQPPKYVNLGDGIDAAEMKMIKKLLDEQAVALRAAEVKAKLKEVAEN